MMDISRKMAKTACDALSEKKAEDLRITMISLYTFSPKRIVFFTIWKKSGQMVRE